MASIGDDTESQLYMLREAYEELQRKSPNHELLELAKIHSDRGGFDFTPGFAEKFVSDTDRWKVHGYARYTFALKNAIENRPYKTVTDEEREALSKSAPF